MKKKSLDLKRKLNLNKETISKLNSSAILGGGGFTQDENCIRPITVTCNNCPPQPVVTAQGGTMCGTLDRTVVSCAVGAGCASAAVDCSAPTLCVAGCGVSQ